MNSNNHSLEKHVVYSTLFCGLTMVKIQRRVECMCTYICSYNTNRRSNSKDKNISTALIVATFLKKKKEDNWS